MDVWGKVGIVKYITVNKKRKQERNRELLTRPGMNAYVCYVCTCACFCGRMCACAYVHVHLRVSVSANESVWMCLHSVQYF